MKLEKKIDIATYRLQHAHSIVEYVSALREHRKLQERYMKHHFSYYVPREIKREEGVRHD